MAETSRVERFHLGDRVRKLRKAKDWTQDELAKKAGLSRDTIVNLEESPESRKAHTLRQVARALKVDLATLVSETEAIPPVPQTTRKSEQDRAGVPRDDPDIRGRASGTEPRGLGVGGVVGSEDADMREIEDLIRDMNPDQFKRWRAKAIRLGGAILSGGDPKIVEGPPPSDHKRGSG